MTGSKDGKLSAGLWSLAFLSVIVISIIKGAIAAPPIAYEKPDLKALESAFVDLAEKVAPCVVAVQTYRFRNFGGESTRLVKMPLSKGSGMIISSNGLILTNDHVVDGAQAITVSMHNGATYDAELLQGDVRSDLAVLKIDEKHLKPIEFADFEQVRVGQWAFAAGNPFGLALSDGRPSVTYGTVSALERQLTNRLREPGRDSYYGNLIETSTSINPGNSGGPLFNVDGEVIGVICAVETYNGESKAHGFAIPADRNVQRIVESLSKGEPYMYGFMGVLVRDPGRNTARSFVRENGYRGAMIDEILIKNGPADKADLRPNDVIIEFDGIPVRDTDHFVRLVSFAPVGMAAEVKYVRRNVERLTTVVLGDRFGLLTERPAESSEKFRESDEPGKN